MEKAAQYTYMIREQVLVELNIMHISVFQDASTKAQDRR